MLEKIIAHRKEQLAQEKNRLPLEKLLNQLSPPNQKNSLQTTLSKPGLAVIAEIKQASPSKGLICKDFSPLKQGKAYVHHGADAISVLTEEHYFLGNSSYITLVQPECPLPLLRKDFIFDPYQVYESYYLGAQAILLIAAILSENELKSLYALASKLSLDVLLEIHDKEDLKKAMLVEPTIIGINNRNLNDFSVSVETSLMLKKHLPKDQLVISESGIFSSRETKPLREAGFAGILVGEALMKSNNIADMIADLKEG